jgi:hypothetical protein
VEGFNFPTRFKGMVFSELRYSGHAIFLRERVGNQGRGANRLALRILETWRNRKDRLEKRGSLLISQDRVQTRLTASRQKP